MTTHVAEGQVYGLVLGKVVATLRERRGMTQGQLAQTVGVSQPVLSRIEAGKQLPDVFLHQRIALALGLSDAQLTAHVQEAMRRTKEAAVAATAQMKGSNWGELAAVAGFVGLAGLILFAVSAMMNEEPKQQSTKQRGTRSTS